PRERAVELEKKGAEIFRNRPKRSEYSIGAVISSDRRRRQQITEPKEKMKTKIARLLSVLALLTCTMKLMAYPSCADDPSSGGAKIEARSGDNICISWACPSVDPEHLGCVWLGSETECQ